MSRSSPRAAVDRAPYQDQWRRGRLVAAGRRECADRYTLVRDALEGLLGRGFSVADVGGWDGYFGVRLAEDLGAKALNVDRRPRRLSIRHLTLRVTADTVAQIGRHDAILALSVLHHMPDWREVYERLRAMCRWLVVELAEPAEADTLRVGVAEQVRPAHECISRDACQLIGHGEARGGKYRRPIMLVQGGT